MSKVHYIFPDVKIEFCEWKHAWDIKVDSDENRWDTLTSFYEKEEAIKWARDRNNLSTDWFVYDNFLE